MVQKFAESDSVTQINETEYIYICIIYIHLNTHIHT